MIRRRKIFNSAVLIQNLYNFIKFFNDKLSYCIHSCKHGTNTSVINLKYDIKNEAVDLTHYQKFDIGHIGHKDAQYNCDHRELNEGARIHVIFYFSLNEFSENLKYDLYALMMPLHRMILLTWNGCPSLRENLSLIMFLGLPFFRGCAETGHIFYFISLIIM